MDVDLRDLRYFLALARQLSFVAAARELNITQPALSRSIAALEAELGQKLLDRHRSGCTLTSAGVLLAREASVILDQTRALRHNLAASGRGELGHLQFGIGPLPATLFLGRVLGEATHAFPSLTLRARTAPVEDLIGLLQRNAIEFLIGTRMHVPLNTALVARPFTKIPLAWLARDGHPLAGRPVKMVELNGFPFANAGGDVEASRDGEPDRVFGKTVAIHCDSYNNLMHALRHSDAFCMGTPWLRASADGIVALDVEDNPMPVHANLVIVNLAGRDLSPMARAFIDWMREIVDAQCRAFKEVAPA